MPPQQQGGSAAPNNTPASPATTGSAQALREANRRLLLAALEANEERDTQAALATAMRELLEKGAAGDLELRSEVELLRTITANVSSALLLLDVRNHPLFINPAGEAMFGYRLSEIKDAPFHEAVHHHLDGEAFPIDACPIHAAITQQTSLRDHRTVFVRKDGALLPVGCNVSPLQLGGLGVGAVLEVRDRSAQAHAEEAKRDFVAMIAHDLRTPLTSVQGQVQLLQRQLTGGRQSESGQVAGLESIERAARRMATMIEELLEASRLESGVVPLSRTPIDLSALVAQVVGQMVPAARARVSVRRSTPAIIVFADGERIERVLANLLSNAFKYSPPDAPVQVDVRRGDGEVLVAVVDHGAGIPNDQLPQLFQRFVRAERSAVDDPGGLGLGLYIVRLIVEAHGGRVWARSEVGKGSTVSFALPLDAADGDQREPTR